MIEETSEDVALEQSESHQATLCVDLDNTLIATDMLWELIMRSVSMLPLTVFLIPFWLLKGRAYLKRHLAESVSLSPEMLPYRPAVMKYLAEQQRWGREIVLATAADRLTAETVANHVGLFSRIFASDGKRNLRGNVKSRALKEAYGNDFVYMGDSSIDLKIWKIALAAVVVSKSQSLVASVAKVTKIEKQIVVDRAGATTVARAMRFHHWGKNLLLFVPLLLSHRFSVGCTARVAGGVFFYGMAASSIYILNDLLDLPSDRAHPWKSKRPFACGDLSIPVGLCLFCGSLLIAIVGSILAFGIYIGALILGYAALSIAYSVWLKKIALLDVFCLASFYVVRLIVGGAIARVQLSTWFIVFSLFLFFSLAMAKRYSELVQASALSNSGKSRRGYVTGDRELLSALGVASAFSAIVVLALYTQGREVFSLYRRPELLLAICPVLLYWVARIWLLAHRGELDEDPVTLAMKDGVSYAVLAVALGIIAASGLQAG